LRENGPPVGHYDDAANGLAPLQYCVETLTRLFYSEIFFEISP